MGSTLAQSDIGHLAALAHLNSVSSTHVLNHRHHLAEFSAAAAAALVTSDAEMDQDFDIDAVDDIDSFIASATVPPPPSGDVTDANNKTSSGSVLGELTSDDISQFIIPPPPSQYTDDVDSSVSKDKAESEIHFVNDLKKPNINGEALKLRVTGPRLPGDGKPSPVVPGTKDGLVNGHGRAYSKSATTSPAHQTLSSATAIIESIAERKERLRMALNGDGPQTGLTLPLTSPPKLPPKPSTTPTSPASAKVLSAPGMTGLRVHQLFVVFKKT